MKKKSCLLTSLLFAAILSIGVMCGCGDTASDEGEDNAKATEAAAEEPTTAVAEDGVTLSDDSSDFVLVTDVVPDAIFEIRYYSTYNFVGDRIDGYEEPLAFMTKEAADALLRRPLRTSLNGQKMKTTQE